MKKKEEKEKTLAVLMGMPLRDFLEPPKDQPGCKLRNCPECSVAIWVSARKRRLLENGIKKGEVIILCPECMRERFFLDKKLDNDATIIGPVDISEAEKIMIKKEKV